MTPIDFFYLSLVGAANILSRADFLDRSDAMSIEFLRQIAATPLPKSFTNAKDIDAVKILRQAGLVIALVDQPPESAATVFAITDEGNAELLRFHYPENDRRRPAKDHWLPPAAQRACEALKRSIRGA